MSDTDRTQDTPFTIKGHWWLPGSSHRVAGDLIYSVTEMTLVLYGGLNDAVIESPFTATPEQNEFPIIHGESLKKVPVTILNSFYTKWIPDITTLAVQPGTRKALLSSALSCHKMLEGVHLDSPDDTFAKCRIQIPNFEEWLGDSPFAFNVAPSGENVHIDYTRPRNEEFRLDTCKCRVRFVRAVTPPGIPLRDPSIKHRAYVDVEASESMPVNWFCKQATEVVDLFSFMYGGSVLSRRLTVFRKTEAAAEVSLFYARPDFTSVERNAAEIMVRYRNVKDVFPQLLSNWLTASEAAKTARRIVLSCEQRPSTFIELRFLPLIHALECLTKEIDHSTIASPEVFKNAVGSMLASLPNDLPVELVDSIKSSLGWANGRNLKGKLKKMLDEYQDATCQLFCSSKEMFIKGLVNTRNYFTHYSPQKKLLRDAELHWAIRKTSLMLRILLLLKAGMSENDLQPLVHSHHRLSQERAVWSTFTEEGSPINETDDD